VDKMVGERRENNLEDRHFSASGTARKRVGKFC